MPANTPPASRETTQAADADRETGRFIKKDIKTRLLGLCVPEPNTGCWLWTSTVNPVTKYACLKVDGRMRSAHRTSYETWNGPIPVGLELDHLCRVRTCINPRHLEPVTHRENMRRSDTPSSVNLRKTVCVRGHQLEPYEGTRRRRCVDCHAANQRTYVQRNREKINARERAKTARRTAASTSQL